MGGSGRLQSKKSHVVSRRSPLEAAAAPPLRVADSQGPCPAAWPPRSLAAPQPPTPNIPRAAFLLGLARLTPLGPSQPPSNAWTKLPEAQMHIRFPEGEARDRQEAGKPPRIGLRGQLGLLPTGEQKGGNRLGGDGLGLLVTHSSCYKTFSGR